MEMNFYLDNDVAEKIFEVKNRTPRYRKLSANEFAKEIISNYIINNYYSKRRNKNG